MSTTETSLYDLPWYARRNDTLSKGERDAENFRNFFSRADSSSEMHWIYNLEDVAAKKAHADFLASLNLPFPNLDVLTEGVESLMLPFTHDRCLDRQIISVPTADKIGHVVVYYAHPARELSASA